MWILLLACGGDRDTGTPPGVTGETGVIETTETGTTETGTAETGTTDTTPPEPSRARFFAVGDSGLKTDQRDAVAAALATVCETEGCDFGLLAGDNFYECGVDSAEDPRFEEDFEEPFGGLGVPVYAVLGNHGYREFADGECVGGEAFDGVRAGHQVTYSNSQDTRFVMPATDYLLEPVPGLLLLSIDTQRIMYGRDDEDVAGVSSAWTIHGPAFAAREDAFRVVLAHHPYLSNGQHGIAGEYTDRPAGDDLSCLEDNRPASAAARGAGACLKVFYDDFVCGRAALMVGGHDHNLALYQDNALCPGTDQILSGAGAKLRALDGELEATWETDTVGGFAWVSVCTDTGNVEDIRFYGDTGALLFALSASDDPPEPCAPPG